MSDSPNPSQRDIDQIAAYVEAAEELKKEPFFHADEKRMVRIGASKEPTYYFGDRFHFRSALVSFRRIWLNDEASNFNRCCNIIMRYNPEERVGLVSSWKEEVNRIVTSKVILFPGNLQCDLKVGDLIDLWLNAVFAHVAVDRVPDTRHEFETALGKFGQAPMEHAFRHAVWELGLNYINLCDHGATGFLRDWEARTGTKPSFQIGAPFGVRNREITPDGHTVIRKSSTKFFNEEPFEKMFERISSRDSFKGLRFILERLDLPYSEKVKSFVLLDTVEEIIFRAGMMLSLEEVGMGVMRSRDSGFTSFTQLLDPRNSNVLGLAAGENKIAVTREGVEVLNLSLSSLKSELRREAQDGWN